MIHVVAMKCLIGLPLLIHIELLWRSRSRSVCVPTPQPCITSFSLVTKTANISEELFPSSG
jgi:hypothetical protein